MGKTIGEMTPKEAQKRGTSTEAVWNRPEWMQDKIRAQYGEYSNKAFIAITEIFHQIAIALNRRCSFRFVIDYDETLGRMRTYVYTDKNAPYCPEVAEKYVAQALKEERKPEAAATTPD